MYLSLSLWLGGFNVRKLARVDKIMRLWSLHQTLSYYQSTHYPLLLCCFGDNAQCPASDTLKLLFTFLRIFNHLVIKVKIIWRKSIEQWTWYQSFCFIHDDSFETHRCCYCSSMRLANKYSLTRGLYYYCKTHGGKAVTALRSIITADTNMAAFFIESASQVQSLGQQKWITH